MLRGRTGAVIRLTTAHSGQLLRATGLRGPGQPLPRSEAWDQGGQAQRESFKICSRLIEGHKSEGKTMHNAPHLPRRQCYVNTENNGHALPYRQTWLYCFPRKPRDLKITQRSAGDTFLVSQLRRRRKQLDGLNRDLFWVLFVGGGEEVFLLSALERLGLRNVDTRRSQGLASHSSGVIQACLRTHPWSLS